MKKKMTLVATSVLLVAAMVIGGTLAYFTDTDTKTNTFTIGNIEIAIDEIFPENELMPGSATENNLQKEVYVENTGANDAYMWIEVLIPVELDTVGNASENDLHFNYYDTYLDEYGSPVVCSSAVAMANGYTGPYYVINEEYMGKTTIDGVTYNRYLHYTENDTAKKTGEKTAALLAQVYMDKGVTQCEFIPGAGEANHAANCMVLKDGTHYAADWELIINAYGIQADGLNTIAAAINAYYGETVI